MTRIRRAKGGWDDDPNATPPPGHFQRADGRVMTQAEIAAAVKVGTAQQEGPVRNGPAPTAPVVPQRRWVEPAEVWEAVERLGTQVAAAIELGITQTSVQNKLDHHMNLNGISGPRPGLLPKGARVMSRLIAISVPKPKPSTEEAALLERTRPFVEARSKAIEESVPEPETQTAPTPPSAWRERLEERYVDLLLRRAEEAPADDPVFDRIERLVGMLAP
jgi:hypothetical protein